MVARDLLQEHRFLENYTVGEDVCLWIALAYSSRDVGCVQKVLTYVEKKNSSASDDLEKQSTGYHNIISYLEKIVTDTEHILRLKNRYLNIPIMNFFLLNSNANLVVVQPRPSLTITEETFFL